MTVLRRRKCLLPTRSAVGTLPFHLGREVVLASGKWTYILVTCTPFQLQFTLSQVPCATYRGPHGHKCSSIYRRPGSVQRESLFLNHKRHTKALRFEALDMPGSPAHAFFDWPYSKYSSQCLMDCIAWHGTQISSLRGLMYSAVSSVTVMLAMYSPTRSTVCYKAKKAQRKANSISFSCYERSVNMSVCLSLDHQLVPLIGISVASPPEYDLACWNPVAIPELGSQVCSLTHIIRTEESRLLHGSGLRAQWASLAQGCMADSAFTKVRSIPHPRCSYSSSSAVVPVLSRRRTPCDPRHALAHSCRRDVRLQATCSENESMTAPQL